MIQIFDLFPLFRNLKTLSWWNFIRFSSISNVYVTCPQQQKKRHKMTHVIIVGHRTVIIFGYFWIIKVVKCFNAILNYAVNILMSVENVILNCSLIVHKWNNVRDFYPFLGLRKSIL